MNWLASFFKNLANKSDITLVLFGRENSGKEILFDEIIKPLFGEKYCSKIDDERLEDGNLVALVRDKVFYNLNDITSFSIENKKTKTLLKTIMYSDIVWTEYKGKDGYEEIKNFAQTLITITEPYIPYLDNKDNKHTVFKVGSNIEDMYIPPEFATAIEKKKFSKEDIVSLIRNDLSNFALILKLYSIELKKANQPYANDDKASIIESLDDKIKSFSNAIINVNKSYFAVLESSNQPLHKEIMKDFDKNRIKQKNLIKCFTAIYKEEKSLHSRTLMVKLRAIKENRGFFETSNLDIGTGGVKYFIVNN